MNSQEYSSLGSEGYQIHPHAIAAANASAAYPTMFNPVRRNVAANWGDQSPLSNLARVSAPSSPTLYFNPSEWNAGPPTAAESSSGIWNSASCSFGRQRENQKNGGKSNNKWTEEQTAVLVREWKENIQKIESSRNVEAWQELTAQVNQAGPQKSPKQCKDKLKNLKQAYKEAKANNKESGRSPKWSPFFDDFDEVLGTRPIITTPGVIQAGQSAGRCASPSSASTSASSPRPESAPEQGSDDDDDDDDDGSTSNPAASAASAAASQPGTAQKRTNQGKKQGMRKRRRTATNPERDSEFTRIAERMLEMQSNQLDMLNEGQRRAEEMWMRFEVEQRKADEEAHRRDQEFFVRMAEILKK